jgi:hypothetical protein
MMIFITKVKNSRAKLIVGMIWKIMVHRYSKEKFLKRH